MKQIWLIDDDEDDADIFRLALRKIPFKSVLNVSTNGEEAFEYLQNNPSFNPDYIFLDLNMPKMNGVNFLSEMRTKKIFNEVPLFIYTTSSFGPDISTCLALGGTLVTKHNDFAGLCEELKNLLH